MAATKPKSRTILVTGGAGFIGSHTVVELTAAGYRPVIVDNFVNSEETVIKHLEKLTGSSVTFYKTDYRDTDTIKDIIQKERVEGAVHFAAHKAVGESVADPLKYYDNNVCGFVKLLEALLEYGVHKFVFSSSAAVYGEPDGALVTEQTPCRPTSPYGWSKYMDEIVLRDTCAAHSGLNGIALRYFNVVGAHDSALIGELPKGRPQNLLPVIVQAAAGKIPPLTVFGDDYPTPDGSCLRDYIHVVDLAKAHVAALDALFSGKKASSFRVYNIGTGKPTSVLELIKTFEKINGLSVPYSIGKRRPGDPAAYHASADKAAKELGWRASKTVEDAVRDAWRWQQAISLKR